MPRSVLDPERRSALLGVKLGVLARDHKLLGRGPLPQRPGLPDGELTTFPGGAALSAGDRGAVLIDGNPARGLGPALAWAERHDVADLHVLVEDRAGQLARQALLFAAPPTVWWVQDRDLHPVEPEPRIVPPTPSDAARELAWADFGSCETAIEHDVYLAEVLGLEVARVVEEDGHPPRVEVGIGRHDREAFAIIHGDRPPAEALAGVVDYVKAHRRADGPDHALRRISPERWLRNIVIERPELAATAQIGPGQAALPRPNVRDMWPAVAWGQDPDGHDVCIVCSVGVDLDLVPFAADARLTLGGELRPVRLKLVVPERDAMPITRALASALTEPAEIFTVPDDWRTIIGG